MWENSSGFSKIGEVVASAAPAVLKTIDEWAADKFPAVDASVRRILGAIHMWAPQSTKWVQQALNTIQTTGAIHFGDPLVVDGIFGNKTFAAVVLLQSKLGLKITGAVTDVEYAAINKLIAGK
jgi:peptidoglycan hydrolase-like protein with peptidoglycan-binding domain